VKSILSEFDTSLGLISYGVGDISFCGEGGIEDNGGTITVAEGEGGGRVLGVDFALVRDIHLADSDYTGPALDLIVEISSATGASVPNNIGFSGLGAANWININEDSVFDYQYTFVESGTVQPVHLDSLSVGITDLDARSGGLAEEQVRLFGSDEVTFLSESEGGLLAATYDGEGIRIDPSRSANQWLVNHVVVDYENVSSFTIEYDLTESLGNAWHPGGWNLVGGDQIDFSGLATDNQAPTDNDFNGDGDRDIVWRNTESGCNTVWEMDGTNRTDVVDLDSVTNLNWNLAGTGDLTGDGQDDLLWRNTESGRNMVWEMNGTERVGITELDAVSNLDWNLVGAGDLTGDGQEDLLWRNTANGRNVVWEMNGTERVGITELDAVSNLDWNLVGAGDLTGDGQEDLLWRNTANGRNVVWEMNGTERVGITELDAVTNLDWSAIA
jgi:hypothetical protein